MGLKDLIVRENRNGWGAKWGGSGVRKKTDLREVQLRIPNLWFVCHPHGKCQGFEETKKQQIVGVIS